MDADDDQSPEASPVRHASRSGSARDHTRPVDDDPRSSRETDDESAAHDDGHRADDTSNTGTRVTSASQGLGQPGNANIQPLQPPQPRQQQRSSPRLAVTAPDNTNSYVEPVTIMDDDHHGDSVADELHVRRHLQDVESSFVPPISPLQVRGGPDEGQDDTYVFDAEPAKVPLPSPSPNPSPSPGPSSHVTPADDLHERQGHDALPIRSRGSGRQPENSALQNQDDDIDPFFERRRMQAPRSTTPDLPPDHARSNQRRPDISITDSEARSRAASDAATGRSHTSTSGLEQMPSSPTASALARSMSKGAASQYTSAGSHDAANSQGATEDGSSHGAGSRLHVPRSDQSYSSGGSLLRPSNESGDSSAGGRRPKFLRSRHASQRSSTDTAMFDDESDATIGLGTDYTVQSGGPLSPPFGMRRSLSNMLSRSISIGSIASGLDSDLDATRPLEPLEPLTEVDSPDRGAGRKSTGFGGRNNDSVSTPRTRQGPLAPPTDTVIARHVRDVEVPESLAAEYKTKGGFETPQHNATYRSKASEFTPAPGTTKTKGNMTLKEQSSTIERLSKENFDLKLKVMFLSDRLDKLSESNVKEMISENVELKTSLAVIQRDNKALRKKNKDLEKRLRDRDDEADRPSTAKSGYSSEGRTTPAYDPDAQEREEELHYLRERVEDHVTEIEHLKSEKMAAEADKRKLAEMVKAMGDRAGERVGDGLGRQEEADVFKDLLEQETARREQTDDDNRRLRDEIFRLKQEMTGGGGPASATGSHGMHHTTNIYNITRKGRPVSPSRSRPVSGLSGDDLEQVNSQASTLVDELRRETEQLRHENAELRREVGAQTSMLTSRNREKERLYQEIEDLKLAQRRGAAPSTIDSLLDRSASRTGGHERSHSRGSARTRLTMAAEDPDREELENKLAEHRDKLSEVKMQNQELQRELETCMQDFEIAVDAKQQAEEAAMVLQQELDNALNDLMAIQTERDQVLQDHQSLEMEFDALRNEAQEEINALEGETDDKDQEIQRLELEVQDRAENFDALQEEMRKMSEAIVRLEDEHEKKLRRIEQLESELSDAHHESEELENKLMEANEKANRLGVQQESSQDEIGFLREEQEADKIRIGDLEAAVANAEQGLRDERERVKELDQRLNKERRQYEMISSREKEEVQQFVNELNREMTTAKDESRRLRKSLTNREVEATEWKERLMELENNLREALGDLNGTRSSLLKSIGKLQRELENTVNELDQTKASMVEKDRIIKQRDALLESHGLESRKLAEMLDKERQAHRNTKNTFDTFQRTHQHVTRTVTSQDGRISELESIRQQNQKKINQLENQFKEQLTERNNLLLVLWTRLSAVCGTDWAHNNSLINGRALPSLEAVATMLPGFSKNLLAAVKMIETLVGGFQNRIKGIERQLWKEYNSLDENFEQRIKKLDRLEAIVRNGVVNGDFNTTAKISQLEAAYRALKIENATLQRANDAKTRAVGGYFDQPTNRPHDGGLGDADDDEGSPSPSVPTGPTRRSSGIPRSKTTPHLETSSIKSRTSTMTRTMSSHSNAGDEHRLGASSKEPGATRNSSENGDKQWMFRLRELEYKLKQEREARNLDRAAARQRIAEGERQKDELVAELVRVKRKGE